MYLFKKNLLKQDKIIFVAEIGINHEGSLKKAKRLILLAKKAGADAVKFQSFSLERYCSSDEIERYKRLKKFSLTEKQFYQLYKFSKKNGINFLSTALTEDYVKKLAKYSEVVKVASGDMSFLPVIEEIIKSNVKAIISTGMHDFKDVKDLIAFIRKKKGEKYLKKNFALMHCTTSYPPDLKDVNINVIRTFKEKLNLTIGYSNHILDQTACITAIANGAKIIEVHFTDKRKGKKFHDHFISYEPNELKSLIELSKKILISLGSKQKKILDCEKKFLKAGKKGLIVSKDLANGQVLKTNDIMYARPATYFNFKEKKKIVGRKIVKNLKKGQLLKNSLFKK